MDDSTPLPDLTYNGAADPDLWRPTLANLKGGRGLVRPEPGALVGWRYGAWRIVEVHPVADVDLTAAEAEAVDRLLQRVAPDQLAGEREQVRPLHVVLRHESGPFIVKPGEESQQLADGSHTVHRATRPGLAAAFAVLTDPYRTCSCHGHIWPCQAQDRDAVALLEARHMERLMATTEPGVCASCLEPVTARQTALTFPEPSLFVPGAPGPTFHAGRKACWGDAEEYERGGRLATDPHVVRLASCPGLQFLHEKHGMPAADRLECTAGPACTGQHGPPGYRKPAPCWQPVSLGGDSGGYAQPITDCGYHAGNGRCQGSEPFPAGPSVLAAAADLIWRNNQGGNLT